MKKNNILIVMDGVDFCYIKNNIEHFSLFKEWYKNGKLKILNSIIPVDSIPSWTTIYTGLNPAEHGIIETIDYLNIKKETNNIASIKGKSFWDLLSQNGKKVFIFNPFIASPAWEVNGLMISKASLESGKISTNRPDIVDINQLNLGSGLAYIPTYRTMNKFIRETQIMTDNQFYNFTKYMESDNYNFAFLGITTPDRLQHFLWKYIDQEDRCHKKNNPFKNEILKGYLYFEKHITNLVNLYEKDYNIIVISDHGHGRRCQKTFYINQWLIENSFIQNKIIRKRMLEYAKNLTLYLLSKFNHVQIGINFLKKFTILHKYKNADHISKRKEIIYAPNFNGVNPYGGIILCHDAFESEELYEKKRQEIIDGLKMVTDNGFLIMEWVKRREEIYQGTKLDNYPDIIYKMDNDYGVDRGLFGKRLFGISAFHEIVSGGHRFEGVIMSNNYKIIKDVKSVSEIYNMIIKFSF